jgi:ABC-2 type transport system ATP-binding protein
MDVVEKVSDRIVLIDEGRIIANGSFEELQQLEGGKSLEQIFAKMTGKTSYEATADELMKAFEN